VKDIKKVKCVQGINKNLISVSEIKDQGSKVEFVKSGCHVKDLQDHYKFIGEGIGVGGIYKIVVTIKSHQALLSTSVST
jgi:hypothetical protein